MSDLFNDNNLFGDSFDLLQSNGNNLFGESEQATNNKASQESKTAKTSATTQAEQAFSFDDNLFSSDASAEQNLFAEPQAFRATNNNATLNNEPAQQNVDFGFDSNLFEDSSASLFGEQETKSSVPLEQNVQESENNQDINFEADLEQNLFEEPNENLQENIEETSQDKLEKKSNKKTKKIDDSPKNKGKSKKEKNAKKEKSSSKNKKKTTQTNADLVAEEAQVLQDEPKEETVEPKEDDQSTLEQEQDIKTQDAQSGKNKDDDDDKEKKNIFKNKKFIIIASSIAAAILLVVLGVVIFSGGQAEKFSTPNFMVYKRSSGTVLIIDNEKTAQGYEVVIYQNGSSQAQFTSANSTVELRLYLSTPGVFSVKVRILGASAGEHSDYSEPKTFTNFVKLDTPEVFRNQDILSWNAVANASSYKVYYKANTVTDSVDFVELPAVLGQDVVQFDLTELNAYGAGLYPVCVEAIASGEYRLNSAYSAVNHYEYHSAIDDPMAAVYDSQSKQLSFAVLKQRTKADKYLLNVSINNGTQVVKHFIIAEELESKELTYQGQEVVLYTASLSEILSGEPHALTLIAMGDGIYSTDSSAVDVLTI